jgi:hypothetical protein
MEDRSGEPKFVHARKSQGVSATALSRLAASTTGFEALAESEVPLGEGGFLSLKASPRGSSR